MIILCHFRNQNVHMLMLFLTSSLYITGIMLHIYCSIHSFISDSMTSYRLVLSKKINYYVFFFFFFTYQLYLNWGWLVVFMSQYLVCLCVCVSIYVSGVSDEVFLGFILGLFGC